MFSPYYKKSGRHDPVNHACLNVALYGPRARWAMTERPRGAVERSRDHLVLGPSEVRWQGDALEITIREKDKRLGVPWQRPVTGTVRVIPEMLNEVPFKLDRDAHHVWHCHAPRARIEVAMQEPGLSWSGSGYLDHNRGSESLEDGFRVWHWSRAHLGREGVVCYEGVRRDGSHFASALRFDAAGVPSHEDLPPVAPLPDTAWLLERKTRADRGEAQVVKTWENAPFYARSTVAGKVFGERVLAVQESLDLDRFASPIVQLMLPYRMPRARG